MILDCQCGEKKFVVPDNAISATGRLVQCSSCGNKWTQFPIGKKIKAKEKISKIKSNPKKIQSSAKITKRKVKKKSKRKISGYYFNGKKLIILYEEKR